jgi:hypothetical protein
VSSSRRFAAEHGGLDRDADRLGSARVARLERRGNFRWASGCLRWSSWIKSIMTMLVSNGPNGSRTSGLADGLEMLTGGGGAAEDALGGLDLFSATKSRMTISVSKGSGSQTSELCFEGFRVKAEAICLRNLATGEV